MNKNYDEYDSGWIINQTLDTMIIILKDKILTWKVQQKIVALVA